MKIADLSSALVRNTPWFVAAAAVVSYLFPGAFIGVHGVTAKLVLGFIMLTMGMTLTADDFRAVAARPWEIAIGAVGQFTLMPLIAFTIASVLPENYRGVGVGLILVGCCPGGVSSNLMSFLCKGDVAFSVGMTTVSTLLAPVMTPLLTALFVGWLGTDGTVSVDALSMFRDLLFVTLLPVALGFTLNRIFSANTSFRRAKVHLPALAVIALAAIVAGVMAGYRMRPADTVQISILAVFAGVLLHNSLGYALGYTVGVAARFNGPKRRTVSIEVGMQNAGLATELSKNLSANVQADAAIAAAVSCVWHSISGALLAGLFNAIERRTVKTREPVV